MYRYIHSVSKILELVHDFHKGMEEIIEEAINGSTRMDFSPSSFNVTEDCEDNKCVFKL